MRELGVTTYMKWGYRAARSMESPLKEADVDLSKYTNVWLGGPIHSWTIPSPLRTWVNAHKVDLAKKQLAVFCTGGGPSGHPAFFSTIQGKTNNLLFALISIYRAHWSFPVGHSGCQRITSSYLGCCKSFGRDKAKVSTQVKKKVCEAIKCKNK